jgi:hypothetical protein
MPRLVGPHRADQRDPAEASWKSGVTGGIGFESISTMTKSAGHQRRNYGRPWLGNGGRIRILGLALLDRFSALRIDFPIYLRLVTSKFETHDAESLNPYGILNGIGPVNRGVGRSAKGDAEADPFAVAHDRHHSHSDSSGQPFSTSFGGL